MAYSDVILADSPYLYWKMDETSGTTATDLSGNNRHGTYQGSPTLNQSSVSSILGTAVTLVRTSSQLIKWTPTAAYSGDWSVEEWIYPTGTDGYWAYFGAHLAGGANYGGLFARTDVGAASFDIFLPNTTFNGWAIIAPYPIPTANTWTHMVSTYDAATDEFKVYFNGSQVGTTKIVANAGLWNTGTAFTAGGIGQYSVNNPNTPDSYFNGKIDEVAIYYSVLSPARITAHYNAAFVASINISAPVANITLIGLDADLLVGGSADIGTNTPEITWTALEIAYVGSPIGVSITTNVANVAYTMFSVLDSQLDVLADNPNAFWQVDAATTASIPDIAANAPLTKVNPTPFTQVTGREGNPGYPALKMELGNSIDYRAAITITGSMTNEFWINMNNGNNVQYIWSTNDTGNGSLNVFWGSKVVSGGSPTSPLRAYTLAAGITGATNAGAIWETGYPTETHAGQVSLAFPGWNHIAVTCQDQGNNNYGLRLFWNGSLVAEAIQASVYPPQLHRNDGYFYLTNHPGGIGFYWAFSYDDIAVWNYALDPGEVQGHVVGIETTGLSVDNVPDVNWGTSDPSITSAFNLNLDTELAATQWRGLAPILAIDGFVDVTTDEVNSIWRGYDVVLLSEASLEQAVVNIPELTFNSYFVTQVTRPDQLTFVFVDGESNEFTAYDSTLISELNFGVQFPLQKHRLPFRLGNTSPISANFFVQAEGLNPMLVDNVSFSLDKAEWTSTLLLEHIPANGVTDVIYVRLEIPEDSYLEEGTFVVAVIQDVD